MIREKRRKWFSACLEGSYTVEAALVMSAALFFIAALLNGVFDTHSSVVGRMVLQEAIERETRMEEAQSKMSVEEGAEKDLKSYFWCGGGELKLEKKRNRVDGTARTSVESSISVKIFDPERFLRLLTAAGV